MKTAVEPPDFLLSAMDSVPEARRYVVAFSGGLDSTVLLLLAVKVLRDKRQAEVRAIHVHHGLSPNADAWAAHCQRVTDGFVVPLTVYEGRINPKGEGVEAAARALRYTMFHQALEDGELLLQGHHLNDQAETVLHRLIQGKSVGGLAGIPVSRKLSLPHGEAVIYRPLLGVARAELMEWAGASGLSWIDDESNSDLHFDRNFIRHQVIPRVEARWPKVLQGVAAAAAHCEQGEQLLREVAADDLVTLTMESTHPLVAGLGWFNPVLDIRGLSQFSTSRRDNLLRYWFEIAGAAFPGHKQFDRMLAQVIPAKPDARAVVRWSNGGRAGDEMVEVRKFGHGLYLGPTLSDIAPTALTPSHPVPWGKLSVALCEASHPVLFSEALTVAVPDDGLEVRGEFGLRMVEAGDQMALAGRPRKSLRDLMKEVGIPYWLRPYVPCLAWRGEVIAVPHVGVASAFLPPATTEESSGKSYAFCWGNSL